MEILYKEILEIFTSLDNKTNFKDIKFDQDITHIEGEYFSLQSDIEYISAKTNITYRVYLEYWDRGGKYLHVYIEFMPFLKFSIDHDLNEDFSILYNKLNQIMDSLCFVLE